LRYSFGSTYAARRGDARSALGFGGRVSGDSRAHEAPRVAETRAARHHARRDPRVLGGAQSGASAGRAQSKTQDSCRSRMAADSTMLRTMKRFTALSLGTSAPLDSQNTRLTCGRAGVSAQCVGLRAARARTCPRERGGLLRPELRRFFGMVLGWEGKGREKDRLQV